MTLGRTKGRVPWQRGKPGHPQKWVPDVLFLRMIMNELQSGHFGGGGAPLDEVELLSALLLLSRVHARQRLATPSSSLALGLPVLPPEATAAAAAACSCRRRSVSLTKEALKSDRKSGGIMVLI